MPCQRCTSVAHMTLNITSMTTTPIPLPSDEVQYCFALVYTTGIEGQGTHQRATGLSSPHTHGDSKARIRTHHKLISGLVHSAL